MRFILKFPLILVCLTTLNPVFAVTHTPTVKFDYKQEIPHSECCSPSRVYVGAYGGYGVVKGAYENDGAVTFGRLTLGLNIYEYQWFSFGGELGVQSGNSMRLETNSIVSDALGGLQPQATLKPFSDFLFIVKAQFVNTIPLFCILKGGIAYRQLQLEISNSPHDTVRKVNGELQVGLGYHITEHAMLTAFYQGIYAGSNAEVSVDASGDNTYIKRIPTEQAGFLGVEYSL